MNNTPFSQQTSLSEAFGAMAAISSWKTSTKGRYRRAIRFFEEYLERPAVLQDVTPISLELFFAWMCENRGSAVYAKGMVEGVKSVVNRAAPGNLPHGSCDKSLQFNSDKMETIDHVMVHQYFPSRMKISNKKTELQYAFAVSRFARFLGRSATLEDLDDQTLGAFMRHMRDEGLAPQTINGYWAKLRAFWTWCAKRRMVEEFPTLDRMPEPAKIPRCWTKEELKKLFDATLKMPGEVAGIPAGKWWQAIHFVVWDSGERAGAVLALRWEWFSPATGELEAPAEIRKGGQKAMLYKLKPVTVAALEAIRQPERDLIFQWSRDVTLFHADYKKLLELAGLPYEKGKSGLQKMRRSFASHIEAKGGNATAALDHTTRKVTVQSYLDPRIVQQKPANLLLPDILGDTEPRPKPGLLGRLLGRKGGE